MWRLFLVFLSVVLAAPVYGNDVWESLRRTGGVVLLRHAQTDPGVGDPPGFKLGDCATQRNLSAAGRVAAQRLGERFARAGIKPARVFSSEWCRCRDTAALAFGAYAPLPALNSFFDDRTREAAQSEALRKLIGARQPGETIVLVTHQVNITALTGIHPAMGEAVVVTAAPNGALREIGRIGHVGHNGNVGHIAPE